MSVRARIIAVITGLLVVTHSRDSSAQVTRIVSPREFVAAHPTTRVGDTSRADILLPAEAGPLRSVVILSGGIGAFLYDNSEWRMLCARARCASLHLRLPRDPAVATGENGVALVTLLDSLAAVAGQPELSTARLLFIGSSAAGAFGASFASWKPERTAGFIAYHTNMNAAAKDWAGMASIPALLVQGALDNANGKPRRWRRWIRHDASVRRGDSWFTRISRTAHSMDCATRAR